MSSRETKHLRVLIANERKDRLALVAPIVVGLGHEVIAREIDVEDVGPATARERPDIALVGLGESSEHALELIDKIVREAACPVIVLLHARDPEFIAEASKRGVFAHISDADVEDWQSAIDIVLRRFAEYQDLQGAFGRRALTERAKGILMERHGIDEASAFEMLREQSRIDNRKLIDLATAVVDGHRLLPESPKLHLNPDAHTAPSLTRTTDPRTLVPQLELRAADCRPGAPVRRGASPVPAGARSESRPSQRPAPAQPRPATVAQLAVWWAERSSMARRHRR
jgi:AmiR/NasT family two-component response regulator